MTKYIILITTFTLGLFPAFGQDNFEIQVYESEITELHTTMFELHSNYTLYGSKTSSDKILPSNHQLHETVEITHGFFRNYETGFYFFTAMTGNGNIYVAGSHIRPRFSAPDRWKLPFGLSISSEFGYMTDYFTDENWSLEIRPIIDKRWNKLYLGINPALEKALSGPGRENGFVFTPAARCTYNFFPKVAFGLEYYGSLGQISKFDPVASQQHNLYFTSDITVFPDWEVNCGYSIGLNPATDNGIFKLILGYRFSGKHPGKN